MKDDNDGIRKQIEHVLFTHPGERVNQPDFGVGLQQYIFEPDTAALRSRIQKKIQTALSRWLGDLIDIEEVEVEMETSSMTVIIQYIVRSTKEMRRDGFFYDIH